MDYNNFSEQMNSVLASVSERVAGVTEYSYYEGSESDIADELPTNNTTDIISTTSRFSSALWFDKVKEQQIILAGVGGIGSYVAYLLSRMQPAEITLYDNDNVEVVNMSGQMYCQDDIGNPKVSAIRSMMNKYSNYYYTTCMNNRYDSDSMTSNVMICGFDNMAARNIFFYKWLEHVDNTPAEERHKCLFIDGRLNAEEFQVLCVTGDNAYAICKYKEEWLFEDSEVEEAVCSYKQTSYMATMIGSIITNLFVNFCANLCNPIIPRDIPFLSRYDGTTMFFKTE